MDQPLSALQLRCQACGAAYSSTSTSEILTCQYCGTSQRVVDARQFLDHFMAQVTAFVRQAVPLGLDGAQGEHVDPVARLSAFNSSVRPRISTESEGYRFSCFSLLSASLAVLPFSTTANASAATDPATVSVFSAKVQSVALLAVDDSSRELIARASGLATAYQTLLVSARLMGGSQPERFHLIHQNLATASKAIESTHRWLPLATRLSGLADECAAVDSWLTSGKTGEARKLLSSASEKLSKSRAELATSPELGYLLPAVDQELATVRIVGAMLDISENSAAVAPPPLVFVERLSGILNWLSQNTPPDWAPRFRTAKLWETVFTHASRVRAAQGGRGSVKVGPGEGSILIPFWVVELPYTFETGALWGKRGKEVPEILLVAATFPTDVSTLTVAGSSRALTDVFAAGGSGPMIDRYYNRLTGREQKISESGGLASLVQGAASTSSGGRPMVPPLTSEAECLRLIQLYLDSIRSRNPKVAGQLRASSPRVLDLVYFPCEPSSVPVMPWLGGVSPGTAGDPRWIAHMTA